MSISWRIIVNCIQSDRYVLWSLVIFLFSFATLISVVTTHYFPQRYRLEASASNLEMAREKYSRMKRVTEIQTILEKHTQRLVEESGKLTINYRGALVAGALAQLLSSNDLSITKESYEQPLMRNDLLEVGVFFIVNGSFSNIRRMMLQIEHLPFLASIQDAALEEIGPDRIRAEMRILLYFAGDKGNAS